MRLLKQGKIGFGGQGGLPYRSDVFPGGFSLFHEGFEAFGGIVWNDRRLTFWHNAGPGVAARSGVAEVEWKRYFFAGAAGLAALAGVAFPGGQ
ncbi:MAG: hypothetical protein KG012_03050 [Deltaproteobacteria bacterium]|nr:hypothetical protein [Deltaproteobacteria bacterium]